MYDLFGNPILDAISDTNSIYGNYPELQTQELSKILDQALSNLLSFRVGLLSIIDSDTFDSFSNAEKSLVKQKLVECQKSIIDLTFVDTIPRLESSENIIVNNTIKSSIANSILRSSMAEELNDLLTTAKFTSAGDLKIDATVASNNSEQVSKLITVMRERAAEITYDLSNNNISISQSNQILLKTELENLRITINDLINYNLTSTDLTILEELPKPESREYIEAVINNSTLTSVQKAELIGAGGSLEFTSAGNLNITQSINNFADAGNEGQSGFTSLLNLVSDTVSNEIEYKEKTNFDGTQTATIEDRIEETQAITIAADPLNNRIDEYIFHQLDLLAGSIPTINPVNLSGLNLLVEKRDIAETILKHFSDSISSTGPDNDKDFLIKYIADIDKIISDISSTYSIARAGIDGITGLKFYDDTTENERTQLINEFARALREDALPEGGKYLALFPELREIINQLQEESSNPFWSNFWREYNERVPNPWPNLEPFNVLVERRLDQLIKDYIEKNGSVDEETFHDLESQAIDYVRSNPAETGYNNDLLYRIPFNPLQWLYDEFKSGNPTLSQSDARIRMVLTDEGHYIIYTDSNFVSPTQTPDGKYRGDVSDGDRYITITWINVPFDQAPPTVDPTKREEEAPIPPWWTGG